MSGVAISGYYGYGNVGDEIILDNLVEWLRTRAGIDDIVVLSGDPAATSSRLRVRSVQRYSPIAVVRELLRSSLLVSGGGSLIQDRTSVRSALYYLAVLAVAKVLGRRVAVVGQGLGPVNSRLVRTLVRAILSRIDYISLRDRGSVSLLRSLGEQTKEVRLGADLAFLEQVPGDDICDDSPAGARPVLLVVPGLDARRADLEWPALLARELRRRLHGQSDLDVLAFQSADACPLDGLEGIPTVVGPDRADQVVRASSLVVSARFHGLVLAVRAGVPGIALGSDPKIRDFASEAGLPWVDPESMDGAQLVEWVWRHVCATMRDYARTTQRIRAVRADMRSRAEEGMDGLMQLLQCSQSGVKGSARG